MWETEKQRAHLCRVAGAMVEGSAWGTCEVSLISLEVQVME